MRGVDSGGLEAWIYGGFSGIIMQVGQWGRTGPGTGCFVENMHCTGGLLGLVAYNILLPFRYLGCQPQYFSSPQLLPFICLKKQGFLYRYFNSKSRRSSIKQEYRLYLKFQIRTCVKEIGYTGMMRAGEAGRRLATTTTTTCGVAGRLRTRALFFFVPHLSTRMQRAWVCGVV